MSWRYCLLGVVNDLRMDGNRQTSDGEYAQSQYLTVYYIMTIIRVLMWIT